MLENVGRDTLRQILSGGISSVCEGSRRSRKNGLEETLRGTLHPGFCQIVGTEEVLV